MERTLTDRSEGQPSKTIWLPRFFIALAGAVFAHDTATMLIPAVRHYSDIIAAIAFAVVLLGLARFRIANKTAWILAACSVIAVLCFGRVLIGTVGYPQDNSRPLPPR